MDTGTPSFEALAKRVDDAAAGFWVVAALDDELDRVVRVDEGDAVVLFDTALDGLTGHHTAQHVVRLVHQVFPVQLPQVVDVLKDNRTKQRAPPVHLARDRQDAKARLSQRRDLRLEQPR